MGSGQMLYRLHVAYERIYATFDSNLMCCCAHVCHVTHSSPFHRISRAARAARQMTCTPAYKQLKHYVGAIATPLAMLSVVCFWTHPLVYRICKCFRNWPRPMIESMTGWHALPTLLPVIGCATGQLHVCGHMRRCHWPYLVCLI